MKIAVTFGSRSTEHDVSIISGITILKELQENSNHEVLPLYITKKGIWEIGGNLEEIENHRKGKAKGKQVSLIFSNNKKLTLKENGFFGKVHEIDFVMPIMHGMNGEDGTLQGVLEMSQVPYAGPGVLGSALGMDKIAMKDILKSHNLPLVPYVSFYRNDWQLQPDNIIEDITKKISFPIFVKPANLGSSIGISKAKDKDELENAIEVAAHYDSRIICEQGIEDLQEINCAIVGNPANNETSLLEEPISYEDFLNFEEKYINSGGTMQGVKSKVKIPAELPEEKMTEEIQSAAKKVFKILDCSGVSRVDFLVDTKNKKFYINEINTIPGSLQSHLWEKSGFKLIDILKRMIEDGLEREREKEKNSFAFHSEILSSGNMKK
jgi:D-alanine-D-alanine ligase